jgi:Domain of unknown function (DUF4429)/Short C-terminal domain
MDVSAKGFDGTVSFDGRAVTISRSGFNARVQHHGGGSTVIPIERVSAVEFKPLGVQRGRITIVTAGAVQRKGGIRSHADDPMSVEFLRRGDDFKAVRDAINEALMAPSNTQRPAGEPMLELRLSELGRLRADGVLTEDEFVAAKAQLLAR